MNNFYTVIENQINTSGAYGLLYNHYEDQNQAYARYFTICATAAIDELPYHAVHLIRDDGVMMEGRVWDRRVEEEPEEQEPEQE